MFNFHLMLRLHRIFAITTKEFKELRRDRLTFGMVVMVPLIQLILFGYAINTDVRGISAGVVDLSQTHYSRAAVASISATQVAHFNWQFNSIAEAEAAITEGKVRAVLVLPADFTRRIDDKLNTQPHRTDTTIARPLGQWLVDGSDTLIASAIKNLRLLPLEELLGKSAKQLEPTFEMAFYFNPEQRTAVNIVPGLLAVILTMTMILFTATAIVREHEQGNMEFLITTPIHPLELMLGKIIPYVLAGLVQTCIILSLGHILFGVPINGSMVNLFLAVVAFILASLTLGLIISTLVKTQLQAMQMTVFILLPSILLSGFMFPYEAMPVAAQYVAELLPATHFMRCIRGVVLRSASLEDLTHDLAWLVLFCLAGLVIASLRFKKRLD
ncbi:MAG TPA: ABC transporter permease [Cellvibrionaceae bacterium]